MTNADKIRAMSDVQLAVWLTHIEKRILTCQPTLGREALEADWLDWLKEEATE